MKYTVCVVTGTRAEFGLLKPLMKRLYHDREIQFNLVVTGSHLDSSFGNTQEEIVQSGFPIHARIPIHLTGDTKADMARATGEAVKAFTDYFANQRPDILVLLGDRYEIFGAATAAALLGIVIAHIHGGETTQGAVDEFLRHSITKMSYLHFTACEDYRHRVIQLGEDPERVFYVGALGVENIKNFCELSEEELENVLGIKLTGQDYGVVTFHPATQEENTVEGQLKELIGAMDRFSDMKFIITKANADAGGRTVNGIWDRVSEAHDNWKVVSSLGVDRYLSVLKHARIVLGNSSSGILEAPSMKIPTVNIGDRQKGRFMAASVISCKPEEEDICHAIRKALSPGFSNVVKQTASPFGDGNTSHKIFSIIKRFLKQPPKTAAKAFYDITF